MLQDEFEQQTKKRILQDVLRDKDGVGRAAILFSCIFTSKFCLEKVMCAKTTLLLQLMNCTLDLGNKPPFLLLIHLDFDSLF